MMQTCVQPVHATLQTPSHRRAAVQPSAGEKRAGEPGGDGRVGEAALPMVISPENLRFLHLSTMCCATATASCSSQPPLLSSLLVLTCTRTRSTSRLAPSHAWSSFVARLWLPTLYVWGVVRQVLLRPVSVLSVCLSLCHAVALSVSLSLSLTSCAKQGGARRGGCKLLCRTASDVCVCMYVCMHTHTYLSTM